MSHRRVHDLVLLALLVISACAPSNGGALPPAATQTAIPATPAPKEDEALLLAPVEVPREIPGVLPLEWIPGFEASLAEPGDAALARAAAVRAEAKFVPVVASNGVVAVENGDKVACAVLPSVGMRDPKNPDQVLGLELNETDSKVRQTGCGSIGSHQTIPECSMCSGRM